MRQLLQESHHVTMPPWRHRSTARSAAGRKGANAQGEAAHVASCAIAHELGWPLQTLMPFHAAAVSLEKVLQEADRGRVFERVACEGRQKARRAMGSVAGVSGGSYAGVGGRAQRQKPYLSGRVKKI